MSEETEDQKLSSEETEDQELSSEEPDHGYFSMIPHLADDQLDAWQMRLYVHWKRCLGESSNEWKERTTTTATATRMSVGQVSKVRKQLYEMGYIDLKRKRFNNFTRIYVIVRDIWPQNMAYYSAITTNEKGEKVRPTVHTVNGVIVIDDSTVHTVDSTVHTVNPTVHTTPSHRSPHERIKKNNQHKKKQPTKEKLTHSASAEQPQKSERMNPTFTSAEIDQSIKILTDPAIRLSRGQSEKYAGDYSFEAIRAFCCDFVAQGKEAQREAGLITNWLKTRETVPLLVKNDLWSKHMTDGEKDQEGQAEALRHKQNAEWDAQNEEREALPPVTSAPPAVQESEAVRIWRLALEDLSTVFPAPTSDIWLRDTIPLDYQDGKMTIGVPHKIARDWLDSRGRTQTNRILSRQAGKNVEVFFVMHPQIQHQTTTTGG